MPLTLISLSTLQKPGHYFRSVKHLADFIAGAYLVIKNGTVLIARKNRVFFSHLLVDQPHRNGYATIGQSGRIGGLASLPDPTHTVTAQ